MRREYHNLYMDIKAKTLLSAYLFNNLSVCASSATRIENSIHTPPLSISSSGDAMTRYKILQQAT